jgi:cysteine desulfurase
VARLGFEVVALPVTADGTVAEETLAAALDESTALLSLMWANNETGALQPIETATRLAKAVGALVHSDAVQAAGKLPIALDSLPLDLLTLSGHKLHGPKGVGALFVRKGVTLAPHIFGAQERGRRGGTENVAAIAGLGEATALAATRLDGMAGVAALRDRLEQGLCALAPAARVIASAVPRTPNCSAIAFADANGRPMEAEALLTWLDREGICVSMGSACSSGDMAASHVLTAMGAGRDDALSVLRFSLAHDTEAAAVDRVLTVMGGLLGKLAA